MIKVVDKIEAFKYLYQPTASDFATHEIGGKSFEVCHLSSLAQNLVIQEISKAEGCLVAPVLGFYRRSDKETDPTVRIHNDKYINGETVDGTCIIYMNKCEKPTGTAFWELKKQKLDNKRFWGGMNKFNEYLTNDAHKESLWQKYDFVPQSQGKMLLYDADMYHSKYPHHQEEERIIIVMFYKRLK